MRSFLSGITLSGLAAASVVAASAEIPPQPLGGPPWEMDLIFADEFDGTALNEKAWKSEEYGERGIKNETLRGPSNLEVKDGNLLLHVRKEERSHKGKTGKWTAAFLYSREPVENNVFIESRFRPGAAAGVNNAFWMACITEEGDAVRDKYEIDIVETRKDVNAGPDTGRAHLAWHDWKTFKYVLDAGGKRNHIAQGIHAEHSFDAYHTWGLWYGENELIFYLDGREMWRGRSHELYRDQWWTGIGKFTKWFSDEEQRAYGKYGQEDWSYNGGYTGDRMNIIFSNLPWSEDWTPLSDEADGTTMAVDYVRVFKPKRLLNKTPAQLVTTDGLTALEPGKEKKITLDPPLAPDGPWPRYFSLVVKKAKDAGLTLQCADAAGTEILRAGVDAEQELFAGIQQTASSASAYPIKDAPRPLLEEEKEYLLVVRVTPGRPGTLDAVSMSAFELPMKSAREPYFYPNIDPAGNTGAGNGWQINQKGRLAGTIAALTIENNGPGGISYGAFRSGDSFASVLPQ